MYPLTPIVKPSPSLNGALNNARFGTSWNLIWASRSSIFEIDIDSGKMVESPSVSSSSRLVGKRTD
jgi:hypothetical protein